jgi:hypothetical protein
VFKLFNHKMRRSGFVMESGVIVEHALRQL